MFTSGIGFALTGHKEILSKFKRIASGQRNRSKKAILKQAKAILRESKEIYCPVDEGDLAASGRVGEPQSTRGSNQFVNTAEVKIEYTAEYAEAVHEHESSHSPPSWKGKTINWTKPGTGPKFLEIPLKAAVGTILPALARDLQFEGEYSDGDFDE